MRYARIRFAALLLGVGLGASLDGIVFHQLLHWQQMLSAVLPPDTLPAMRHNLLVGGWVHLAAWVVTVAGVFALWRGLRLAGRVPSTRSFCGYLVIGWGVFHLAMQVLSYHPVFLAAGIGFILIGLALRDGRRRVPAIEVERRAREVERRSGEDRRLSC